MALAIVMSEASDEQDPRGAGRHHGPECGASRPLERAQQDNPAVLLRAAIEKEEVVGDLNAAIEQYKHVIKIAGTDARWPRQALLRLGGCYEKRGPEEARQAYQQLIATMRASEGGRSRAAAARGAWRGVDRTGRRLRPHHPQGARLGHVHATVAGRKVPRLHGLELR